MPKGGTKPYSVKHNDEIVPFGEISQKIKDKAHKEGDSNPRIFSKDTPPVTKQGL